MRVTIPQCTYDAILKRLDIHHTAHKGQSEFPMIKKGLEKNARIGREGVEVDLGRLEIASDAIRDNMKFAGQKYGTAPDKSVLLDIDEAIADHSERVATPNPIRNSADDNLAQAASSRLSPNPPAKQREEPAGIPYDKSKKDTYPPHRMPLNWSDEWTMLEPVMGGRTGRPSIFEPSRELRYRWIDMSGILIERETGYGLPTTPR